MRVLFVTSWYPSMLDSTNGNFVERHALALLSGGHQVVVVHEAFSNRILFPRIVAEGATALPVYQVYLPRILKNSLFFRKLMARKLIKLMAVDGYAFDIVHGHILLPVGPSATYIAGRMGLPLVFTEHWSGFLPANSGRLTKNQLDDARSVGLLCSRIMPVSENLAASMKALDIPGKYRVIYNAVDTDLFHHRPTSKLERFTFLHVSNFAPVKNVEGIINAFVALQSASKHSVELMIVGDGDLASLEDYVKKHYPGISSIRFLGTQTYDAIAALMQAVQCVVLFSNYENLPCVIAESHCCGVPVIATSVGGIPEMVDSDNGCLIDPKDEVQLANAMKQLLDRYSSFHPHIIQSRAHERYGYQRIAAKFESVYKAVLDEGKL